MGSIACAHTLRSTCNTNRHVVSSETLQGDQCGQANVNSKSQMCGIASRCFASLKFLDLRHISSCISLAYVITVAKFLFNFKTVEHA
jgi:hypothetical protein